MCGQCLGGQREYPELVGPCGAARAALASPPQPVIFRIFKAVYFDVLYSDCYDHRLRVNTTALSGFCMCLQSERGRGDVYSHIFLWLAVGR